MAGIGGGGGTVYAGDVTTVINSFSKSGSTCSINASFTFTSTGFNGAKLPELDITSTSGGSTHITGNRYDNDPLTITFTITANDGDNIVISNAQWSDPSESGDSANMNTPKTIYSIPLPTTTNSTTIKGFTYIDSHNYLNKANLRGGFGFMWGAPAWGGALMGQRTMDTEINGQVRIEHTEQTTISGQARIAFIHQTDLNGQVDILKTNQTTISGQTRIENTKTTTISGRTRIERTGSTTINGQTLIETAGLTNIAGQVDIKKANQTTISGRVRIEITNTTDISGQTRIEHTEQTDISGQTFICHINQTEINGVVRIENTASTDITGQVTVTDKHQTHIEGMVCIVRIERTEITGQVSIIQTIPEKLPHTWEYDDSEKLPETWEYENPEKQPQSWENSTPKVASEWDDSSANDKLPQDWEYNDPEKEPETWEYEQYEIKSIPPVYKGANYGGFGTLYGVAYGSSIERPLERQTTISGVVNIT